ncbi:MAG TPA: glycosyl hydrolase family 18 protein, partial [Pyrinomonadaceae bacterium]|nr:glycosyl hydrolase family 18 protein [Pyrinomonadaceae bacterium]
MTNDDTPDIRKPVFFDERGRRWRAFNIFGIAAAVTATAFLAFFVISVLINPFLPQLQLKSIAALPQRSDTALPFPELPPLSKHDAQLKLASDKVKAEKNLREEARLEKTYRAQMRLAAATPAAFIERPAGAQPLSIGFYVNWDDSSYASLKQNISALDWVVPEWVRLSGDPKSPLALDIDTRAMDLIREQKPGVAVLPLLQNYKNEQWNSDLLIKSISTDALRKQLTASILDLVAANNFGGITIDIEEVPARSQMDLYEFVSQLHTEFQKRGLILAQAVPFDNPEWNYAAYGNITDYLMLMAYDQHWSTGDAGPVAGQDWFESLLKKRMAELRPERTIVCFGNYGYNWPGGGKEAETVSFQDSLIGAKESLESPGDIKFDPVSKTPYYRYTEDD